MGSDMNALADSGNVSKRRRTVIRQPGTQVLASEHLCMVFSAGDLGVDGNLVPIQILGKSLRFKFDGLSFLRQMVWSDLRLKRKKKRNPIRVINAARVSHTLVV